jgi:iron(III) transport system substrate-binding protein
MIERPRAGHSERAPGRKRSLARHAGSPRRGLSVAIVAIVALSFLVGGCSGTSSKNSILLYNGQHPELANALVAAFEKQSKVNVRVRTNDGIVLADQILQEGKHSPADVYLTENSPELVTLDEHGLLAKADSTTLHEIPERDSAPTGNWTGIALRVSALAYDPALVPASGLPASIIQLGQPPWKDKVGIAPTDSDFPPLVGAVIASHGKKAATDWLAGLKRNAQVYQSDEAVVSAVDRGDIATGVINNYYWYRMQLEVGAGRMHSKLYYFPNHDVGSSENISGAAVLASSAHSDNAQKFLNFLVGKTAQEIIAHSDDFEYPTRPGVEPNPALPPLESIAPAALGPVKLGNDQQAARLIQESGLA